MRKERLEGGNDKKRDQKRGGDQNQKPEEGKDGEDKP